MKQLEAERDRQQSLVDLHEETQQKIEDLERDRTRTIQDLNQKLRDDIYDARLRAHRRIEDLNENTGLDAAERAERIAKVEEALTRRIEDLTRDRNRRIADLGLEQRRQREDLARQASAKEVEIAERAAGTTIGDRGAANGGTGHRHVSGIADAESAAGVAFREAQAELCSGTERIRAGTFRAYRGTQPNQSGNGDCDRSGEPSVDNSSKRRI